MVTRIVRSRLVQCAGLAVVLFGAVGCDKAATGPGTPGAGAPMIAGIGPLDGVPGSIVEVVVTGERFLPGAIVGVSQSGITVGAVTVVGETRIVAVFLIASDAALGTREVTVTTTQGRSGGRAFTIRAGTLPLPTFTGMSPVAQARNTTVNVTLTGTNFTSGATVAVSGSGVSVGNVVVVNSATIQTTFVITGGATVGDRAVTITTPGGTTNSLSFRIQASPPELQSMTPDSGVPGATIAVTLIGANFSAVSSVMVSGVGVTVGSVIVNDEQTITAMLIIAANAPVGTRTVTVTDVGGTSAPRTFTVVAG